MSQELISALYETVWAVNPEYDNIESLGDYLCQMMNQMSQRTQLSVRLQVQNLPCEVQISSQVRHNIIMVVKEATHNVIKHANASEIGVQMLLSGDLLNITVKDDGCGMQAIDYQSGNGLGNMRQRMKQIGGDCSIESKPGHGTTVILRLVVTKSDQSEKPA
jgi:signal transduction histidine kinase